MWNPIALSLRHEQVTPKEIEIGQAIAIGDIPQDAYELRLTAFLAAVLQDPALPLRLTVQERYYILLNCLVISNSDYVMAAGDISEFLLPTTTAPDTTQVETIYIQQLRGHHADFLQSNCENVYDWIAGQMAMQLYGDMTEYLSDTKEQGILWSQLTTENPGELSAAFADRFKQINSITESKFERLYAVFCAGADNLAHLVDISVDKDGIILNSTGGDDDRAARFRAVQSLSGATQRIIECFI